MDLHYQSATRVGTLLRNGALTSHSLTMHMLERIDRLNPKLNAFITVTADIALDQAQKADEELAAGVDRGALHGIPIAIKDIFATKGVRSTSGSKLFENWIPDFNATVVDKLDNAGCVLLGKTGMSELAAGTTGVNPFFGQIENPWKAGYDPGGSSGGSAAAVAAGMAFLALGTDTGCSVREPAHCCGIVGLKPTFGLVSKFGVQPLVSTKDHVGTLTRSVSDAAVALTAIAGPDPKDHHCAASADKGKRRTHLRSLQVLNIGVIKRYFFDCDAEISSSISDCLNILEAAGCNLVEIDVADLSDAFEIGRAHFAEAAAVHEKAIAEVPDQFSPQVRASLIQGLEIRAVDYFKAQEFRRGFTNRIEKLFTKVDVLAAPTSRRLPAKLAEIPEGYELDVWKNTSIFNLTGHPSISIPVGKSSAGLPIGLMLTGALFEDQKLLEIAQLCELIASPKGTHPII